MERDKLVAQHFGRLGRPSSGVCAGTEEFSSYLAA